MPGVWASLFNSKSNRGQKPIFDRRAMPGPRRCHPGKAKEETMPKIKKIVDLSHALTPETPVYPGDPVPSFSVATTIEGEGYNLFTLVLGSQTGSHVDAPYP